MARTVRKLAPEERIASAPQGPPVRTEDVPMGDLEARLGEEKALGALVEEGRSLLEQKPKRTVRKLNPEERIQQAGTPQSYSGLSDLAGPAQGEFSLSKEDWRTVDISGKGFADIATLGFDDEIIGGFLALKALWKQSDEDPETFGGLYTEYRNARREVKAKAQAEDPSAYLRGQVIGGIGSAAITGGVGTTALGGRIATGLGARAVTAGLGASVAQGAKLGALSGAAIGIGGSEAGGPEGTMFSSPESVEQLGNEALRGGVIGTGLGIGGTLLGAGLGATATKTRQLGDFVDFLRHRLVGKEALDYGRNAGEAVQNISQLMTKGRELGSVPRGPFGSPQIAPLETKLQTTGAILGNMRASASRFADDGIEALRTKPDVIFQAVSKAVGDLEKMPRTNQTVITAIGKMKKDIVDLAGTKGYLTAEELQLAKKSIDEAMKIFKGSLDPTNLPKKLANEFRWALANRESEVLSRAHFLVEETIGRKAPAGLVERLKHLEKKFDFEGPNNLVKLEVFNKYKDLKDLEDFVEVFNERKIPFEFLTGLLEEGGRFQPGMLDKILKASVRPVERSGSAIRGAANSLHVTSKLADTLAGRYGPQGLALGMDFVERKSRSPYPPVTVTPGRQRRLTER